jgi:valyl-tRNA synthetase
MLANEPNFDEMEKKWQEYWDKEQIYKFDEHSKKQVYSIDVPPPYASAGHLHVGHALHYTQFEIIARYKRLTGHNVYFAPCFDDNGLPTEKYVEETLKISKNSVTRQEFREICLRESQKVEIDYANRVFKKLGHSYDWSLLYTTISPEAQRVAQTSFLELVKKGDCYRAEEPVIWCPYHQTALAQAELEELERNTLLNFIHFELASGKKVEIATTRPEFLSACVAVFVNPHDERYRDLIGKKITVPIFNQEVMIKSDEKVDQQFGSGIVMVCTFGDKTDIDWWKKHTLELKKILTTDGKLKNSGTYDGMTLKDARIAIVEELARQGLLIKQEKLNQSVNTCWRCGTPVEFLVEPQWFIKALEYKDQLIEQGRKIHWYPEFYRTRYEDWTKNLNWNWCISRQRYFGVPIPVWYCKKCNAPHFAKADALPMDPTAHTYDGKCHCGSHEFTADTDVFDTWMTSSMSPQVALRWLEKPARFNHVFPSSLRPQSHDIIRTWAFYTILKSMLHFNEIPWKDIGIGTFVLDRNGKGMHKSKGNAVWADDLLKQYPVDAFRYWVGSASWGSDIRFKDEDIKSGKKFLIKLWNASRLCYMHLEHFDPQKDKPQQLYPIDEYMLLLLNDLVLKVREYNDAFKTGEAKKELDNFFWNVFCDNYLEIIKDRLYNAAIRGEEEKNSGLFTLYTTLYALLRMYSPLVPHITEELYQAYFSDHEKLKSIHISQWPHTAKCNEDSQVIGKRFMEILSEVRKAKSDNKKPLSQKILLTLPEADINIINLVKKDLEAVTKATEIKTGEFAVLFVE